MHFRLICENQASESDCDRVVYLSWVSVCGGLVMREVVQRAVGMAEWKSEQVVEFLEEIMTLRMA